MKPLSSTSGRLARALSALVALALLVALAGPGLGIAGAHAGAGHHVHRHVASDVASEAAFGDDLSASAHDHECCRPADSSLPCIGGCLVACGLFAGTSASDLQLDHVDLWRAPSGTRPIDAEPDLATPPPKVLG